MEDTATSSFSCQSTSLAELLLTVENLQDQHKHITQSLFESQEKIHKLRQQHEEFKLSKEQIIQEMKDLLLRQTDFELEVSVGKVQLELAQKEHGKKQQAIQVLMQRIEDEKKDIKDSRQSFFQKAGALRTAVEARLQLVSAQTDLYAELEKKKIECREKRQYIAERTVALSKKKAEIDEIEAAVKTNNCRQNDYECSLSALLVEIDIMKAKAKKKQEELENFSLENDQSLLSLREHSEQLMAEKGQLQEYSSSLQNAMITILQNKNDKQNAPKRLSSSRNEPYKSSVRCPPNGGRGRGKSTKQRATRKS